MSLQRRLSWNTALRDVRDDHAKIPAGLLTAKASIDLTVRTTCRPLFAAGWFDRTAIMAAAVMAARAHQERTGATWGASMSIGLKAAWQAARAARSAAAH